MPHLFFHLALYISFSKVKYIFLFFRPNSKHFCELGHWVFLSFSRIWIVPVCCNSMIFSSMVFRGPWHFSIVKHPQYCDLCCALLQRYFCMLLRGNVPHVGSIFHLVHQMSLQFCHWVLSWLNVLTFAKIPNLNHLILNMTLYLLHLYTFKITVLGNNERILSIIK